jgi:hypothetical protein
MNIRIYRSSRRNKRDPPGARGHLDLPLDTGNSGFMQV